MYQVLVVQRRLTHYRVTFFDDLKTALAERGVQLKLLVGHGTPDEEKKQDAAMLPWAVEIPTRYWMRGRLCWQSLGEHLKSIDMIVVTQENRLLRNHLLMLAPRRFRLAFWGHGANLQSKARKGLKERFKHWTTRRVDWWFAYTQISADLVQNARFPGSRITVLNNAVDTSELKHQCDLITPTESQTLREALGFSAGPVGVYVGSLYAEKRLDFLFAAAEGIRREIPGFQLLVVGDGPQREEVRAWCEGRPWARWVGARFGGEKVLYQSIADLLMAPGAVGLGVMDAFACQTPLVTTNCPGHGPEFAYLENGINSIITENHVSAYVEACVRLLGDSSALASLQAGCARSAQVYTLENMVERFSDGIISCLEAPRKGWWSS